MPMIESGGRFWAITRYVWPPSTEPNQVLRWVPVPVGPLTNTRPKRSTAMSGSPLVWIGETTDGVSNVIGPGAALTDPGRDEARAAVPATRATSAQTATRGRTIDHTPLR